MRRVAVTGGRTYADADEVESIFDTYLRPGDVIVEGGANGADRLCRQQAQAMGLLVETHPAQWDRFGRSAGFRRNQEMAESGLDLLIAFPGNRGTTDMVRRCKEAGVTTIMVRGFDAREGPDE